MSAPPEPPEPPTPAGSVVEVVTVQGPGRFVVAEAADPVAVLVLGHGAGGGVDASDLVALARALPPAGVSVLRFEQPWRTAGRKVAVRPPLLDQAWLDALDQVRPTLARGLPLLVGGRSAGARVACRTADTLGAVGVVCLAFPLHPPGRPERSRLTELATPTVPRLVLQGSRDPFGSAGDVQVALAADPGGGAGVRVVDLPGADHGFRVARSAVPGAADLVTQVVAEVAAFVQRCLSVPPRD